MQNSDKSERARARAHESGEGQRERENVAEQRSQRTGEPEGDDVTEAERGENYKMAFPVCEMLLRGRVI